MNNPGDIYKKDDSQEQSPWRGKSRRSSRKKTTKEGETGKGKEKLQSSRYSRARHSSHKSRRKKTFRRAIINILAVCVAGYAIYCGVVAVGGFLEYKGLSTKALLGKFTANDAEEVGKSAKENVGNEGEISPGKFDSLIATAIRSGSLKEDLTQMLDKGLADQAITRYERHNGKEDTSRILELLGEAYMMNEEYSEAMRVLTRLLRRSPNRPNTRLKLAKALYELERYRESRKIARWLLDLKPNSKDATLLAADCNMKLGSVDEAIGLYRKIASANPGDVKTRSKLAMAYYKSGEYGRAITYLEKLVSRNTDNSVAYYNLAVCYAKQGLVEKVIETLRRAERKFGKNFVRTWIRGKEFDSLRDDSLFMLFTAEIARNPEVAKMRVKSSEEKKKVSAELGTSPIQLDTGTDRLINRDR